MKIKNPYKITPAQIKINNRLDVLSGNVSSESVNVGYYDDTKIKERLDILDGEVSDLQATDVDFNRRLCLLEGKEYDFVTRPEFNHLEGRVTTLETIPVGLNDSIMDEILSE